MKKKMDIIYIEMVGLLEIFKHSYIYSDTIKEK